MCFPHELGQADYLIHDIRHLLGRQPQELGLRGAGVDPELTEPSGGLDEFLRRMRPARTLMRRECGVEIVIHESLERAEEQDDVHLIPVRGGARRHGGYLMDALGLAAVGVYDELGHLGLTFYAGETGKDWCPQNFYHSPLEGQARLKNEGLSARKGRKPAVAQVGGQSRPKREGLLETCPPTASAFARGLGFCDSPSRGE